MKKIRMVQRMGAKVTAFVMLIIMLAVAVLSVICAGIMIDVDIYLTDKDSFKEDYIYKHYDPQVWNLLNSYDEGGSDVVAAYCENDIITYARIENNTRGKVIAEYGEENVRLRTSASAFASTIEGEEYSFGDDITVYTQCDFSGGIPQWADKELYLWERLTDAAYALRYSIYVIMAGAVIASVSCFVFLMCSSGRRKGSDEVREGWGTKVPLDILAAGWAVGSLALLAGVFNSWYAPDAWIVFASVISVIGVTVAFVGLCMSFALRVKLGKWWKNTVIFWVLNLLWKLLWKLGRLIRLGAVMMTKIPLVWKSALVILAVTSIEFIFFAANLYEGDNLIIFWVIEKMILIPCAVYCALCLKKLQKGGKALAEGKLGYHVDTKYMIGDLKAHGEHLNCIGNGINLAVDERIKSERMKTELITNVSHDIKTPLTSIINYSDLIAKEQTDNEKIAEYSVVLLRQSERLKRLIDDLVEASKASTGNLEIEFAPFELGVFFTQTAGEYEQKLAERELTLVTKQPEEPVSIMADGRRMWRIFDNLMNNICKYAQGGTRVYMTLEKQGGQAVVTFRNTSREELNISADELMERFTRGDSSRNTEGNGLGLSIAKSLAELQNGSLELTVDGDLFKVILKFPVI